MMSKWVRRAAWALARFADRVDRKRRARTIQDTLTRVRAEIATKNAAAAASGPVRTHLTRNRQLRQINK